MSEHRATFWDWVDKRQPNECWPFQGFIKANGYGQWGRRAEEHTAHREAWRQTWGPIPKGLIVCHTCDNPPCCNPAHLWLGTTAANAWDSSMKGRRYKPPLPLYGGDKPRGTPGRRAFTTDEVALLRRQYELGAGVAQLAREHKCAKSAMWMLLNRRTYREVVA